MANSQIGATLTQLQGKIPDLEAANEALDIHAHCTPDESFQPTKDSSRYRYLPGLGCYNFFILYRGESEVYERFRAKIKEDRYWNREESHFYAIWREIERWNYERGKVARPYNNQVESVDPPPMDVLEHLLSELQKTEAENEVHLANMDKRQEERDKREAQLLNERRRRNQKAKAKAEKNPVALQTRAKQDLTRTNLQTIANKLPPSRRQKRGCPSPIKKAAPARRKGKR